MEFQQILTQVLSVLSLVLGAWLTHFFHAKQREREDEQRRQQEQREDERRREQEQRDEQRRREASQHDWLATEHRRLIYEVSSTAFAARNAILRMHGNDPTAGVEAEAALTEFQNTFRRTKILASTSFDDVCVAAHKCLVEGFVSAVAMRRQGGVEGAEDRQRSWQAIKRFDDEHWPAVVIAARNDWQRGVTLEPVANSLV